MTTATDTARGQRAEDGFTLVETLIALMILAISAGILVQSVALATAQIKTAALTGAAEFLAVSLLAERTASISNDLDVQGVDPVSGLYWRLVRERRLRFVDDVKRASGSIVSIEIRTGKNSPPLYELRSVSIEAGVP
jgi:prepilin-type N-terminal cleavage/methylation domain-containing protein